MFVYFPVLKNGWESLNAKSSLLSIKSPAFFMKNYFPLLKGRKALKNDNAAHFF